MASNLRSQYTDLLTKGPPILRTVAAEEQESWEHSNGYMLLMVFQGLFRHLDTDLHHMIEQFSTLLAHSPLNWKKVDIIKESRSLQVTPCFCGRT